MDIRTYNLVILGEEGVGKSGKFHNVLYKKQKKIVCNLHCQIQLCWLIFNCLLTFNFIQILHKYFFCLFLALTIQFVRHEFLDYYIPTIGKIFITDFLFCKKIKNSNTLKNYYVYILYFCHVQCYFLTFFNIIFYRRLLQTTNQNR